MPSRITAIAVCLLGSLSGSTLHAQQPTVEPTVEPTARTPVDPSKLPVDIGRLQRKFRQAVEREERNGPTIRYSIDVIGQAPRLQIVFPEDNLRFAPPRNGGPWHQDMINMVTPREFRAPVMMDFGTLMRSLPKSPKDKK